MPLCSWIVVNQSMLPEVFKYTEIYLPGPWREAYFPDQQIELSWAIRKPKLKHKENEEVTKAQVFLSDNSSLCTLCNRCIQRCTECTGASDDLLNVRWEKLLLEESTSIFVFLLAWEASHATGLRTCFIGSNHLFLVSRKSLISHYLATISPCWLPFLYTTSPD